VSEQVGLVQDEQDPLSPLLLLGGQRPGRLGDEGGLVEARHAAERGQSPRAPTAGLRARGGLAGF
jgi:hypothetical protein